MFKRVFLGILLAAALSLGVLFRPVGAAVDSWSGHSEQLVTFSQAITLNTSAVLFTGVSTVRPNIRSITLTNTASGNVTIYDGATVVGTAVIGQFGVLANTPLTLTEENLGVGCRATLGNGLYVSGATGTITITARVRVGGN